MVDGGRINELPLAHGSHFPPAPLNLNDFLPLNSPGAFFSPHPSPKRLSHSSDGFHKVWPVPKSPSYGCHPCPGNWGWNPYREETGPPCWWSLAVLLLACCPCCLCGPSTLPGMPVAVHPGAWEPRLLLLSPLPTPLPSPTSF